VSQQDKAMAQQKLTGRLLAAGRVLAGISRVDLATASGVPVETVQHLEVSGSAWISGAHAATLLVALETFGIVIVPEGEGMGAGVQLKFTRQDAREIGRLENEGGISRPDVVP
jgi:hypothetical protein